MAEKRQKNHVLSKIVPLVRSYHSRKSSKTIINHKKSDINKYKNQLKYKVGMAVQKRTRTRIAGMTASKWTSLHLSMLDYLNTDVVYLEAVIPAILVRVLFALPSLLYFTIYF